MDSLRGMRQPANLGDVDASTLARLREVLESAQFTSAGVADLLGRAAQAALDRDETTPARRLTQHGSALETLVRLWLLGASVPERDAARALPGLVAPLLASGLISRSAGAVGTAVDIRPFSGEGRDWWLVADRRPFLDGSASRPTTEQVLGVSPAATSLTQLTVRRPAGRALDLGTGCGVQALLLSGHCDEVVATDVNPRALDFARINAALNAVDIDLREGDLFDPVAEERFDLIVSNPPFVVAPGGSAALVYRDSGLPGDEMVRRVVVGAGRRLATGGVAQVLGNWVHRDTEPWEERLTGWLDGVPVGLDAWVLQREVADPAQYVELWLRDAGLRDGPDYTRRYDEWLGWFESEGITGVGLGWIVLRRTDRGQPSVLLEDWPHAVEQPLGIEVGQWLDRVETMAEMDDDSVLATAWRVRSDVREETVGAPGQADPEAIVLRQQRGLRRARQVDTVQAALVGACDGDLTAGSILEAVGTLLQTRIDPRDHVPAIRQLVAEGYLTLGQ